jgi:hypothetical protein
MLLLIVEEAFCERPCPGDNEIFKLLSKIRKPAEKWYPGAT